jgi:AMP-activated protein kinase-like protein/putative zinc finger protein
MERVGCRDVVERLHRQVDGLSASEVSALDEHLSACAECRGQADRLRWVESALRRPRRATPGFSDRVLRRVRAEGTSRAERPRAVARLGAWGLLPAAAAFIVVAGLAVRGFMNPPVAVVDRPVEPPRVQVELELAKGDARSVAVAGDFNEWKAEGSRMRRGSDGVWRIRLELPPGRYQYAFVIDGEQWMADPQASTVVDSGFSGTNSVLDVSL